MSKILLIDDEPGILDLLYTLLDYRGHDVALAECGRKGLQLFEQERPTCNNFGFHDARHEGPRCAQRDSDPRATRTGHRPDRVWNAGDRTASP